MILFTTLVFLEFFRKCQEYLFLASVGFTVTKLFCGIKSNASQEWSFPLMISSVNVTKSLGNCGFGHIYWRNPWWKTSFFVQCDALRCMTNFSASTKKEIKSLDEDEDRRWSWYLIIRFRDDGKTDFCHTTLTLTVIKDAPKFYG